MKSTLLNMTAVLFGITLVASAGVGIVNEITMEPIAAAKQAALVAALDEVLPDFDATTMSEVQLDKMPITVYTATQADQVVGYAVQSMTKAGFGGVIRLMVGFSPVGEVLNVNVLEQSETPGLGTKMADDGNPLLKSVQGKNPAQMALVEGRVAVRKDGGDVDALTAATISSRAYVDAINRAWAAYKEVATGAEVGDVASGASEEINEPAAQEGGNNE
ncbi:MAG: RnfABCDGE type electron transport complex subunit G [Alistipes sp.]